MEGFNSVFNRDAVAHVSQVKLYQAVIPISFSLFLPYVLLFSFLKHLSSFRS